MTPIRNNEWILESFLKTTSTFADLIVIFDQASDDKSEQICRRFPKVDYNYTSNTNWLGTKLRKIPIAKARELIPGPKILLGLDVDEILTADSLDSPDWKQVHSAETGTILNFEKPDIYDGYSNVIRYPGNYFPLGIVDDDTLEYSQKSHEIHTQRIPSKENLKIRNINGIKFMHYGLYDLNLQKSKERFYSMLEIIEKKNKNYINDLIINIHYDTNYDYTSLGILTKTPNEWYDGWELKKINVKNFKIDKFNFFDVEALRFFKIHGTKLFWNINIWSFNWLECILYSKNKKGVIEEKNFLEPTKIRIEINRVMSSLISIIIYLRNKLNFLLTIYKRSF